jgi:hypothetical protein
MFRDVRERHDSAMCFSPLSVSFPHPPMLRFVTCRCHTQPNSPHHTFGVNSGDEWEGTDVKM